MEDIEAILVVSAARFMRVVVDLFLDATNVARRAILLWIFISKPYCEHKDLLPL